MIILSLLSINSLAAEMTLGEYKAALIKAVESGQRISPDNRREGGYLNEVKGLKEKVELLKLEIYALDGSYTDLILPNIDDIHNLYFQEIKNVKDGYEIRRLFDEELKVTIEIYEEIDRQIYQYVTFKEKMIASFRIYLKTQETGSVNKEDIVGCLYRDYSPFSDPNHYGKEVEKLAWNLKEKFEKDNPQFSSIPGFFSNQVQCQKGDRLYRQYHKKEIDKLKEIQKRVNKLDFITVEGYKELSK